MANLTGVAELAGGLALLLPQRLLDRVGLSRLHQLAGLGLAALLVCVVVCVVVANVHVAQQGQQVHGLPFGAWYYWVRPLLQPVFIAWALYCSGVWAGFARGGCPRRWTPGSSFRVGRRWMQSGELNPGMACVLHI